MARRLAAGELFCDRGNHRSGNGGTKSSAAGNVPTFAQRFRTLVLGFPGFGVSDDFGAAHPMMSAQQAVTAFLDGLGLETVRIIGNSMGVFVATEFALAAPEHVERRVTIGGIGTTIFGPLVFRRAVRSSPAGAPAAPPRPARPWRTRDRSCC
ncbi:alpha/beta fold hydrolase [Nocardia veterana]|uniref:alpha/beta fold hydrolase n=1 Tax=Nocardia veterana TaxID=132249 RepID=UPI000A05FA1B